jgi:hypothetical protein
MEVTAGARHDVAADIVHLHAHTRRYWVSSTDAAHAGLKAGASTPPLLTST